MAATKDPYTVLGVSRTATQDEIKNAYRKLARKLHPDLNPGNKEAEQRFKEVGNAYELLETPEKRAQFDRGETDEMGGAGRRGAGPFYYQSQQGPQGGRYSSRFYGNMNEEDLFSSIFGSGAGRKRGAGFAGFGGQEEADLNIPGEDRVYTMDVDFKDSIVGAEREITLPDGKRLRVKIPAGVQSGTRLRFQGQGGPAYGNAPAGDAYVEVRVRPSQEFRRVGSDLEIDLPISLSEAVLGGEVKVPTVSGAVMMKIPPGANTDTRLRLKGKGAPKAPGSKEYGDEIVVLKIRLPERVDPELQEAIRNWSQKNAYNPRAA